ncbi:MAG: alkaline phosphatase family protein, partial [bacterium]
FGRPIKLGRRFVILGMDGLDPGLVRRGIEEGYLPNFKKMANSGTFDTLKTTWMPLSPVAWSSFISGRNPGKHGIFDFLHRDPETYRPYLSIAQQKGPAKTVEFGPYCFPLSSGRTIKGRQGPAFWTESSRQGVKTSVIRCPTSFPPEPVRGKMLSGLGAPDLKGTQGEFSFFTSDSGIKTGSRNGDINIIDHPGEEPIGIKISGPPNPFLSDNSSSRVELKLAVEDKKLFIITGERRIKLEEEEWSDWVPLKFYFLGPIGTEGQVRFYLKSITPEFELYCSPVNVSSADPAFPISYPKSYAGQLADKIGRFHTLGLTADSGVLKEERVSDVTFLEQANTVLEERIAMLKEELASFDDGLFNFVIDITDRIQHMFWRHTDPGHPLYTEKGAELYGNVIKNSYRRLDSIVGWVLEELNPDDELLICSDHGFDSFRRQVDLNTWLVKNGYMKLQDGGRPQDAGELFEDVDWSRTQAYSLGLAGIYLNREGREKEGIVPPADAVSLSQKIAGELEKLEDPGAEGDPVSSVRLAREEYNGEYVSRSPDLLVGFNKHYRVSWESAIGGMNGEVISPNRNKWSGEHCFDPRQIPASLLTNFSMDTGEGLALWDLIPRIFSRLDLEYPEV